VYTADEAVLACSALQPMVLDGSTGSLVSRPCRLISHFKRQADVDHPTACAACRRSCRTLPAGSGVRAPGGAGVRLGFTVRPGTTPAYTQEGYGKRGEGDQGKVVGVDVKNRTDGALVATATWREDLGCAVLSVWLVGGVYLDGWAHLRRHGVESFFTPWHAVLYTGFLALAGWLATAALRRRRRSEPARRSIPAGYRLGLVGVAVFLAGGLADMIWHQIFGIEVGLEALLSPSHLVLLVGGVLMLTTPLRAAAARHPALPASAGPGLPFVLAAAVTAALAAFFLSYLSVFTDAAAIMAPTRIPEGAPGIGRRRTSPSAGWASM
jgi:hypothetical protein